MARVIVTIALLIVMVPVVLMSLAIGRPVLDHGAALAQYLQKGPPDLPRLGSQLADEVRRQLLSEMSPDVVSRLVFQDVPSWDPLPMDDPTQRMEVVRRVADTLPGPGSTWQELQPGIRDSYLLFLSGLSDFSRKRDRLLQESSDKLDQIRAKRGGAIRNIEQQYRHSGSTLQSTGGVPSRTLDVLLSWVTSPPDSRLLGVAIDNAYQSVVPNPQDNYSRFPVISTPTADDLAIWFASSQSSDRTALSTVKVETTALSASLPTAVTSDGKPEPKATGEVVATLLARKWQIFRIRRPWLNESLLEQYRRDWSLLIDVGWLFEADGPLTRIPIAVVVARDVLYRVAFATAADFNVARSIIQSGAPLPLSVGRTTLIIEPGTVTFNESDRSLRIAPAQSRSQIISVVSVRY